MEITINGEKSQVDVSTVQQLADSLQLPQRGVALAVNNKIVQRALWTEAPLAEGDIVTIIKAAFGG